MSGMRFGCALVVAGLGCADRKLTPIVRDDRVGADEGTPPGLGPAASMDGGASGSGPQRCVTPADGKVVIELLTPTSWARPGTVFSSPPPAPYGPRPIEVAFRSRQGVPLAGCEVAWVVGPGSGWVFPIAPVTDADGHAAAWWTAGVARSETLRAIVRLEGSEPEVTLRGTTDVGATVTSWVELRYAAGEFDGFSLDVTPAADPGRTWMAALRFANCHAGIEDRASIGSSASDPRAIFACWDVDNVPIEAIDDAGSNCQRIESSQEMRCDRPYPWVLDGAYRFELDTAHGVMDRTDFTAHVTDLVTGVRTKLATLRRAGQVRPKDCLSYLQDLQEDAASCLDVHHRAMLIGNVRVRTGDTWAPIRAAQFGREYHPSTNEICANYQYGVVGERFFLSNGGDRVGPPVTPGLPDPTVLLP